MPSKKFKNKKALGLDMGQAAVKAVSLVVRNNKVVFDRSEIFDAKEEGILDDQELRTSVADWLEELGWARRPVVAGLPQYFATTQISDFPEGATGGLDEMVAFETEQLSGLSDERFIHDYQTLPAKFGRKNPAFIGVCRESVANERANALSDVGISVGDLAMNGTAMANTFFALLPAEGVSWEPQILLDIGEQSSTIVIMAAGQILFMGSLLFGAEKYTKALAEELKCSQAQAEKAKRTARLTADDPDSALLDVTHQLEKELRTAIDHWRSQEQGDIGKKKIAGIWLSGGGALLNGLAEHFARTHECLVEPFGPEDPSTGEISPALTTAYGLALQDIGAAKISISFCPPDISWFRKRKKRFGYLATATIATLALIAAVLFHYHRTVLSNIAKLKTDIGELKKCESLVPKLQEAKNSMRHHERMLIPFVEKGNRARKLIEAIEALASTQDPGDWFIYLADEFSYEQGKKKADGTTVKKKQPTRSGPATSSIFDSSIRTVGTPVEEATAEFSNQIKVAEIEQMQSMIVAGYTRFDRERVYDPVRAIVKTLNASTTFEGVDILPGPQRKGREDIFEEWLMFLRENSPARSRQRRHTAFTLRMPFEELGLNPIAPEEKTKK